MDAVVRGRSRNRVQNVNATGAGAGPQQLQIVQQLQQLQNDVAEMRQMVGPGVALGLRVASNAVVQAKFERSKRKASEAREKEAQARAAIEKQRADTLQAQIDKFQMQQTRVIDSNSVSVFGKILIAIGAALVLWFMLFYILVKLGYKDFAQVSRTIIVDFAKNYAWLQVDELFKAFVTIYNNWSYEGILVVLGKLAYVFTASGSIYALSKSGTLRNVLGFGQNLFKDPANTLKDSKVLRLQGGNTLADELDDLCRRSLLHLPTQLEFKIIETFFIRKFLQLKTWAFDEQGNLRGSATIERLEGGQVFRFAQKMLMAIALYSGLYAGTMIYDVQTQSHITEALAQSNLNPFVGLQSGLQTFLPTWKTDAIVTSKGEIVDAEEFINEKLGAVGKSLNFLVKNTAATICGPTLCDISQDRPELVAFAKELQTDEFKDFVESNPFLLAVQNADIAQDVSKPSASDEFWREQFARLGNIPFPALLKPYVKEATFDLGDIFIDFKHAIAGLSNTFILLNVQNTVAFPDEREQVSDAVVAFGIAFGTKVTKTQLRSSFNELLGTSIGTVGSSYVSGMQKWENWKTTYAFAIFVVGTFLKNFWLWFTKRYSFLEIVNAENFVMASLQTVMFQQSPLVFLVFKYIFDPVLDMLVEKTYTSKSARVLSYSLVAFWIFIASFQI